MKPSFLLSLTTILVLSVTACGGGGGGGGEKSPRIQSNNSVSSVSSVTQSSVSNSTVSSDAQSSSDASAVSSQAQSSADNSAVSSAQSSVASSTNSSSASSTSALPGVLSLVSTTPANDATAVERTADLTMTFSAALANTDPESYVTLTKNAGTNVPFSASISNTTLWVTPTKKLALQTPYQISVSNAIQGAAGEHIASTSTLNFTTRDGIWSNALSISKNSNVDEDAAEPQIATDANGNAIAVWEQIDGDETDLVTASYAAGVWSNPVVLGSNIVSSGDIAMNANGQAITAWGREGIVRARIYAPETGTWGTLTQVEAGLGAGFPGAIQVAIDAQGNAIAIWTKGTSPNTQIWVNRYTQGAGWDTAIQLDTVSGTAYTQIAIDSDGNALAVWGKAGQLMSSRYTTGGAWNTSWSTPVIVINSGVNRAPTLSINDSGNAALIWGEGFDVVTSLYSTSSGWGTPVTLNANSNANAKIALDNNGNAIAVWVQGDSNIASIWTSRYSTTTSTWSTPELIEKDNVGAAGSPQVTIDATGNAMVVWRQIVADSSRHNLYASRYVMGGVWGEPTLLEVENFQSVETPQVSINESGDAFVVWSQKLINKPISIWANKFE